MIVGKLPISYFSASGRLFCASASTLVTRHYRIVFSCCRQLFKTAQKAYVGLIGEVLRNFLVDRLQPLAMSAPRGSECNDNVLLRILNGVNQPMRSTKNSELGTTHQSDFVKRVYVEDLEGRRGRRLDVRLDARFCCDTVA